MGLKKKIAAVLAAGAVSMTLFGFAPVPNTLEYHGQYLFAEDGSQVVVHVQGSAYAVAEMPATAIKNVGKQKFPHHGVIALLDARGKILLFRSVSEAKAINAFGAFYENHHRTYTSVTVLKRVVSKDVREAYNGY